MCASSEQEYVLGTNDEELARLGFQHRLWAKEAFALWERAGFAPGHTLLDVGCGPGFASFDLASIVGPTGRVISIDESRRYIESFRVRKSASSVTNIEEHVGDVQRLDLPDGSADGAYARWVLCFVPDPKAVVTGVFRALRPGGVFAVQDYLNYSALRLSPPGQAMERVVRAVQDSWRARGGHVDVARHLPTMMGEAGFTVTEVSTITRAARPGTALWDWPTTFFRNYLPVLVNGGFLARQEQEEFELEWRERSLNPNSVFSTPIVADIIARK